MSINITDIKNCCGCTACEAVCAHNAISMREDEFGFLYPVVDNGKCIECRLCEKVCQFKKDYNRYNNFEKPEVYAIRNKDLKILSRSQSGAAFQTFSSYCLGQGYIIYGAILGKEYRIIRHSRATSMQERDAMLLSKYAQSNMLGVYKQVKQDLKNGDKVLFSGTPCQVAGLKSYLGKKLIGENLIAIDLVCHCVASPKVWCDYLDWTERKYHSKIINACFRDKRYGQSVSFETFKLANGKFIKTRLYLDMFFGHHIVRESCSNCPFTNTRRVGDLTIGDFWGWHNKRKEFDDDYGISLLLVNSNKGKQMLNACQSSLEILPSDTTECMQPQLKKPTSLFPQHAQFKAEYAKHSFEYVAKKYGFIGWKKHRLELKIRLYKVISKIARR